LVFWFFGFLFFWFFVFLVFGFLPLIENLHFTFPFIFCCLALILEQPNHFPGKTVPLTLCQTFVSGLLQKPSPNTDVSEMGREG
jgi:hypothetical protein